MFGNLTSSIHLNREIVFYFLPFSSIERLTLALTFSDSFFLSILLLSYLLFQFHHEHHPVTTWTYSPQRSQSSPPLEMSLTSTWTASILFIFPLSFLILLLKMLLLPRTTNNMDSYTKNSIVSGHGHLVACSKTPSNGASVEASGPPSPTTGPIVNFAQVAPGIYRSSFPTAGNFEHLQSLGLKSILCGFSLFFQLTRWLNSISTLVPEEYPLENVDFMNQNGISHFQVPIPAHKDGLDVIPLQSIAEALKIMLDPTLHPLLIHCNKGKVALESCSRVFHIF